MDPNKNNVLNIAQMIASEKSTKVIFHWITEGISFHDLHFEGNKETCSSRFEFRAVTQSRLSRISSVDHHGSLIYPELGI